MRQAPDIHSYGRHTQAGQPASVEPDFVVDAGDDEPLGVSHGQPRPAHLPQSPYLPVKAKFATAFCLSVAWTAFSTVMALPWMRDLAGLAGWPLAIFIVAGIALLPGMMNAFLVAALLLDRRPRLEPLIEYPGISILVAAYNEEESIADTLKSLAQQQYPGEFEVIVIDDGSKDATAAIVEQQFGSRLTGIAFAGWQPFTDGNSRSLLRARLIWGIAPEQGLSAQVRWRQYASSKDDVDGAYYNPERYRNWDAGLSLRRRVGTWTVGGLAGAGRERADSASWQTTYIGELRAEGPLSGDMRLTIGVLYNRAAGFAESSDYWYGSASIGVIIPLAR